MKKDSSEPREIIGFCACPVCGAKNQRLKINKSGNLYIFCENRCATRFSPKVSDEIISVLRTGQTYQKGQDIIYPASTKNKDVEKPAQLKVIEIKEVKDNGTRNSINGRSNGQFGAVTAADRPVDKLRKWFWDDDDIA